MAAALAAGLLAITTGALLAHGESPRLTEAPSLPASAPQTQSGISSVPAETRQRAADSYGKLPLSFVPNRGQTDERVRFHAQGAGHAFYFTQRKAVLSLTKGKRGVALHLTPLGANPEARLAPSRRGEERVNYLVGSEHQANLPTYRALTYRELWPGIDMVFRGSGGKLKYEFHVRPGADPSRIRLAYRGAGGLSLAAGGALSIATPLGRLRDSRPRSYQRIAGKRVPVGSRYALKGGGSSYGFALGASYDPRRPLVIDPGLVYSTLLGGGDYDAGFGIAVDGSGSAYVTGEAHSTDFPTSPGAFDASHNGSLNDAFVAKLNASGSALAYSTYLGSSGFDFGYGIAVDGSGSAYVTGRTHASDFPTTAGAFDTSFNPSGGHDAFVTKLDANGSALVYSSFLGASAAEIGFAIAVDGSGSAYVTGYTQSPDFPTAGFDTTINSADAFVTKFNPAGSALVYSTFLGESHVDWAYGIAVDGSGSAYVTGETESIDFPTTAGAFDTSFNGSFNGDVADAFVTKLNAAGSALAYSTYLGGTGGEFTPTIAVDGSGSAYVTGSTDSSDFPTTAGAFDTSIDGVSDAVAAKLNAAGSALSYSTYLGGTADEAGKGIAVDPAGNAYLTGSTFSSDFPTTAGAFDTTGAGDAYVAKLNGSGSALAYSTYLGGSCASETGNAIALDGSGRPYVTGIACSANFPTTAGAYDTTLGLTDAFVTKLDMEPFDHPSSASPLGVSLVPVFRETLSATQCAARGGTASEHGAPDLASPSGTPDLSCNPPAYTPGTAARLGPQAVGSASFTALPGNPLSAADEADLALALNATDIRSIASGGDYTPNAGGADTTLIAKLRISDTYNGASLGERATVIDFDLRVPVDCAPTGGPEGSTCDVATSADALQLGTIREGTSMVIQTFRTRLNDSGSNGVRGDSDDRFFATQGIYVP